MRFLCTPVLVVLLLSAGAGSPVFGQPGPWLEDVVEPLLMSVKGTLRNPETITIEVIRNGARMELRSWEAIVYLSVRDYIQFDTARRLYTTTKKYEQWRQNVNQYGGPVPDSGRLATPPAGSAMPRVLEECERNGDFCGTWRWDQLNGVYEARWNNGAVAVISVRAFGPAGITMERRDTKGPSEGLTATYTGSITRPNHAEGTVTWNNRGNITRGNWTADW